MSSSKGDLHPDEIALMDRLRHGDETAMHELIEHYGPSLQRLVRRLSAWSVDGDDILQEVFLIAWRRASSFRGTGSLEGWLRRLAVNRCRNHRRAQVAFEKLLGRVAMTGGDRHSKLGRNNELEDEVALAMAKLSADDRGVLVLYYMENLSGQEIAETIGIRMDAVHVRLSRARGRLRKLLASEGEHDGK